jgi:hypothetical protein
MSVSTETVSLNIMTFFTKNICILVLGNKMSTLTYGLGWAGYQCHPLYQSHTHLKFSLEMMDFLRHIFFTTFPPSPPPHQLYSVIRLF